jgi:hypothetical protein
MFYYQTVSGCRCGLRFMKDAEVRFLKSSALDSKNTTGGDGECHTMRFAA